MESWKFGELEKWKIRLDGDRWKTGWMEVFVAGETGPMTGADGGGKKGPDTEVVVTEWEKDSTETRLAESSKNCGPLYFLRSPRNKAHNSGSTSFNFISSSRQQWKIA